MRVHGLAVALSTAAWLLLGAADTGAISKLLATTAARLESGLPAEPFGDWLRQRLPPEAVPVYRIRPCAAAAGTCVNIEIDVVSRARRLRLDSATDPPRFLGGTLSSPDSGKQRPIEALADLPGHLTAPIRPEPLDCPEGTRNVLRESYAGLHEWCQDVTGRKQGPARSWYSTGRYLMWRGRYEKDERAGLWTECDRFERCRTNLYP